MQHAGRTAQPRETGGILVGFRDRDTVVVTRALVVDDAQSTGVTYHLLQERAEAELVDLRTSAPHIVGYVGDWHTHPRDRPPSGVDLASFRQTARSASDLVSLVVLSFRDGEPANVYGAVARPDRERGRARGRSRVDAVAVRVDETPTHRLELLAKERQISRSRPAG
ncbi:MAG: hypothetical protein HGA44_01715 [Cellulomonadaceae bacterium]|nr:hypothetical protein [Cellulomonadaceae bacterium]